MKKNALLKGTLLLTAAGVASRCIGFFYRIFLSRMFGAEGMGIYELINPITALIFSFCTAGIQSAISKFVAAEPEKDGKPNRLRILLTGMSISGALSLLCAVFVYRQADLISGALLSEPRCAPLLRIVSLSFPAVCIHSCINGYFYGIKKAGLPAFCQLFEQCFRVGSVFFFWSYAQQNQISFSIAVAAVGLVIGEFASMLAGIPIALLHFSTVFCAAQASVTPYRRVAARILLFALPLSANRVCLHLLGAVESARIPVSLQRFGYTPGQAISIYGIFTGMAMTCILFPSALTNSISVLLMPLIAEADARRNNGAIRSYLRKSIRGCLLMGLTCLSLFFLCADFIGATLFGSALAGSFIRTLSFLCPFLYLNTMLFSILNGLGKTGLTFLFNIVSLLIRIAFVFFAIPCFGIQALFAGMLFGQIFSTLCCLFCLKKYRYL